MTVRNAIPADAPAIAVVQVTSWRVAYRGLLPDEVLTGLSTLDRQHFWAEALHSPAPRASALVATVDGAVVGFAAVGPPLHPAAGADTRAGELYALYVDPGIWRRGVGRRLHEAALDRLRSARFTRAGLWVLDGNESAIGFYRHHGWTEAGHDRFEEGPGGSSLSERRLHRPL